MLAARPENETDITSKQLTVRLKKTQFGWRHAHLQTLSNAVQTMLVFVGVMHNCATSQQKKVSEIQNILPAGAAKPHIHYSDRIIPCLHLTTNGHDTL